MTARIPLRPVLIALGLTILAASLGGCGRRSGLDLPPQAQAQADTKAAGAAAAPQEPPPGINPSAWVLSTPDDEPLPPARSPKRKFILDPLLDSK